MADDQHPTSTTEYFELLSSGRYGLSGDHLQSIEELTNDEIHQRLLDGAYLNTRTEMEVLLRFNGVGRTTAHQMASIAVASTTPRPPNWTDLPDSIRIAAVTVKIGTRQVTRFVYRDQTQWFLNNRPSNSSYRRVAWYFTIKEFFALRHAQPTSVQATLYYTQNNQRYTHRYNFNARCLRRVAKTMRIVMEGLITLDADTIEEVNVSPKRGQPPPRPLQRYHNQHQTATKRD